MPYIPPDVDDGEIDREEEMEHEPEYAHRLGEQIGRDESILKYAAKTMPREFLKG